jgi:hypothetical protein
MRGTVTIAASLLALTVVSTIAEAQQPLRLNVRPRSFLDAGNVVAPNSAPNPASAQGQMVSYLASPPWINMRDRFGEGTLPDPVTNGPFVGATNILGPVDLDGSFGFYD